MYLPVTILIATLISCQGLVTDLNLDALAEANENGGGLVGFLVRFKDTIRTGNPKIGVPKLDPYVRPLINVNYTDSFKLRGQLWNVSAIGMSNYLVKKGDFTRSQLTANVSLLWDQVLIRTNYNGSGETADGTGIWGSGYIGIVIRDLKVTVNTKLAVVNGKMAVSSLSSHLHLNKFYFKITGFRDSETESDRLTREMTNTMPRWIEDHQKQVSKINNRLVTKMLNAYLKHFTLNELLKVIEG